ncbi:MAG: hypothetical protein HPKKFMNG_02798 [Planctomycetes bacterium]|nr:hypothetical protein [Planctomycetota bacterium]HRJ78351.1 hypothetical protein [Planctomycetota bacterium]
MIRFRYDPEPEEGLDFQHYTLEGNNAAGYVLLGFNDPGEEGDAEFNGEEGFEGSEGAEMLQHWFETLGEAMHLAESLGISRARWQAPIIKTQSGRIAPPIPEPPRPREDDFESRPTPRIGEDYRPE